MVDLEVLRAYGIDAESLEKKFTSKDTKDTSTKIGKFVDRIRSRVQGGRDFNISNYQAYYALDLAWEVPLKQISPTLLASICDKGSDDKTVLDALKSMGMNLDDVVQEVDDPKTPNKKIKKVSLPAFFQVYVPLVESYVKIRWAKLMNDRRAVPFFKFEPVISNKISRMRCEAITARVETMANQYGFYDVRKQAFFQALHHGECLQFPVEEWHTEKQEIEAKSVLAKQAGIKGTKKKVKEVEVQQIITKEGLRYHLPHITRTFYDRAYPASTFNTDTGATFAGYYRVVRWKDVATNDAFWNKDAVGCEDFAQWFKNAKDNGYWTNVLGCAMDFPGTEAANSGTTNYDSEKHLTRNYGNDLSDKPVVITEYFEKLIPKEWGLGDYEFPVWFRFVVCADTTVMYAAPVAYCPINYYGYDAVGGRTRQISMSLEVMPFQDQFSNLLTQYLLTVRQNLTNMSILDIDVFDQKEIKQIQNFGERFWRSINIFGKSFKELFKRGVTSPDRAMANFKFPVQDTNALLNAMKTILDTLERVLIMSAQEVGQAAGHEQTREEVRHIQSNTSTRVVFTGTGLDQANQAWKKQCYQALMAYGSDEFYAQVPMDEEMNKEDLEKLGFTYDPENDFDSRARKATIKVNKTAIAYESFASERDGEDRINNAESAAQMISLLEKALANPMIGQAMGPEQAIKWLNYIGRVAGFPRDFKLVNIGPDKTPEQQNQDLMAQVQQMVGEASQAIQAEVKKGFEALVQENASQDQEIQELSNHIEELAQAVAGVQQPPAPTVPGQFDTVQPANGMDLSQAIA